MSEFENKNLLREYNIDLCKRIKDVVEEKSPEFYKSGNESFRSKIFLRYGFNTSFALAVLYSAGASEFVEDIPPDFKYPMVHYVRSDYNPHADPVIYQTSLGDFPSMVMDSEGNIHNVYNHIFLDCNGETLKWEVIKRSNMPWSEEVIRLNEETGRLIRINFTIPSNHVKTLSLSDGDYEVLEMSLKLIAEGVL